MSIMRRRRGRKNVMNTRNAKRKGRRYIMLKRNKNHNKVNNKRKERTTGA